MTPHPPAPTRPTGLAIAARDGVLAATLVCTVAVVSHLSVRTSAEREFRDSLVQGMSQVAHAAASTIDLPLLRSITELRESNTPQFDRIAVPLRAVRDAMSDIQYLYTARVDGEHVSFQIDCALPGDHDGDGRDDQAKVGEAYDDAPAELYEAWRTGRTTWTEEPYTDEWGTFLSLFHPVHAPDGTVATVIGVDMTLATHERRMATITASADRGLLLAIAAALCIGVGVTWLRLGGLRAQASRAEILRHLEAASQRQAGHIAELERGRTRLLAAAAGLSANDSGEQLEHLTQSMAQVLGGDFAMFAEVVDWQRGLVESRTTWLDGSSGASYRYLLAGTPCEDVVIPDRTHVVPSGVREAYPLDEDLHEFGMDAYAGSPIHDSEGRLIGLAVVLRRGVIDEPDAVASLLQIYATRAGDLIEQERAHRALLRAKEQAEAASRAKSEFLANMSHEIRTPMTAILGFTDLMLEDAERGDLPGVWRDRLHTVQENGTLLLTILNDVLDLSKIEAGKLEVEQAAVDVHALVRSVVELLRPRATTRGITLELRARRSPPRMVATDPVRLRQILVNLVGNAIKFTERGRVVVWIATRRGPAGDELSVLVRDTGIGMTDEQVGRLFGAFEQADASTTRRFGGTGLGLRISLRLAELLGGCITARSREGRGSVFELRLPLAVAAHDDGRGDDAGGATVAPARDESRPPLPLPTLAGRRVLVVDDGADNRRLLGAILQRAGAEVVAVDGAAAAYTELPATGPVPFDVVLMDMQMPEIDGWTAVRTLRARGCTVPILAVTANAMRGDMERCLAAGCDAYAAKPIDRKSLLREVATLASRRDAPPEA